MYGALQLATAEYLKPLKANECYVILYAALVKKMTKSF